MTTHSIKAAKQYLVDWQECERRAAEIANDMDRPEFADPYTRTAQAIAVLLAHVERLEKAVKPFAKAGELFAPEVRGDYSRNFEGIYNPAAGEDYAIIADDLRCALAALSDIISLPEQGQ